MKSFCLLVVFASVFALAGRTAQEIPRSGGTLRIRPFADDFKPDLDPAAGTWVLATEQIFDGLVVIDADLDPLPALAEYWISEGDGLRTIFLLHKNVRFHNGRELTSDDVKFSFERLLRPETRSPFANVLAARVAGAREFREGRAAEVSGFRTPAWDVFEIEWVSPSASAVQLLGLSYAKVLPKDLVREQGQNFFYKPVGTGAFVFESWMRSPRLDVVGVRLERNPRYFGKKPFVDVLEVSPYFTDEHFRNRELDIVPFRSEDLSRAGGKVISSGPRSVTLLAMSCAIPPFDRPSIRRAIAQALDKGKLAQTGVSPTLLRRETNNFVPPQWPGFFPRDATVNQPEKSRQVLEDQGFFVEKDFPPVTLYYAYEKNNPEPLRFAREVARQLEQIGISVTAKSYQSLSDLKDSRNPFLVKIDWAIDYPDPESLLRPLFDSRSEINKANARFASPELDKLLDEAAAEKSQTRRNALFRDAETILVNELPAVPILMSEQRLALQPYVRGVLVSPLGFSYLSAKEIWLDKREEPR